MKPLRIEVCPNQGHCPGLYLAYHVPKDHPLYGKAVPCACTRQADAERLKRALPSVQQGMTFERFQVSTANQKALMAARRFAEDPWGDKPLLTFTGHNQQGKTHLAVAIVNALLTRGEPALVENVPALLDQLRAGYADDEFSARLVRVKDAPVLVLDDLGAEGQSGAGGAYAATWAQDKLYQIIDHRVVQQLPTIVTTNLTRDQLPERVAARLWNARQAVVVAITK